MVFFWCISEVEFIDPPSTEYSCNSQWRLHLTNTADQPFKCSGQQEGYICIFSQDKADTEDSSDVSQGKTDCLALWLSKKSSWFSSFILRSYCKYWNIYLRYVETLLVTSQRKDIEEREEGELNLEQTNNIPCWAWKLAFFPQELRGTVTTLACFSWIFFV